MAVARQIAPHYSSTVLITFSKAFTDFYACAALDIHHRLEPNLAANMQTIFVRLSQWHRTIKLMKGSSRR